MSVVVGVVPASAGTDRQASARAAVIVRWGETFSDVARKVRRGLPVVESRLVRSDLRSQSGNVGRREPFRKI